MGTRQLHKFKQHTLYEWQKDAKELCTSMDGHRINVIVDKEGNSGKSIFCEYLEDEGLAFEIPPSRSGKDVVQWYAMNKHWKAYTIDLPRGFATTGRLDKVFGSLEKLKREFAYGEHHNVHFDPPQILVFTSVCPDPALIPTSHWKTWKLENYTLVDGT